MLKSLLYRVLRTPVTKRILFTRTSYPPLLSRFHFNASLSYHSKVMGPIGMRLITSFANPTLQSALAPIRPIEINQPLIEEMITKLKKASYLHKNEIIILDKNFPDIKKLITTINEDLGSAYPTAYYPRIRLKIETIERMVDEMPDYTLKEEILDPIQICKSHINAKLLAPNPEELKRIKWQTYALYHTQALLQTNQTFCNAFENHLERIKQLFMPTTLTNQRVFISYAWPLPEAEADEQWIQPFLAMLHRHLKIAGLHPILDIVDSQIGENIYRFMEQAKEAEYTLLICTPSLKAKHISKQWKAVKTELNLLQEKHDLDTHSGQNRVLPIILCGHHQNAYPIQYRMYTNIYDFREKNYIENFQNLLRQIYNVHASEDNYTQLWSELYNQHPTLRAIPEENSITEMLKQPYHASTLLQLKQGHGYQTLCQQQNNEAKYYETPTLEAGPSFSSSTSGEVAFSPVLTYLAPTDLNAFQQQLRESYQDQTIPFLFQGGIQENRSFAECYTQLELVKEMPQSQYEQDVAYTTKTSKNLITESIQQLAATVAPIPEQDIFKRQSNDPIIKPIRRIFIEGAPGIGKSTFCRYLTAQWAQGASWLSPFDWCVLVPLRELWHQLKKVDHFDPTLLWQFSLPNLDPEVIHLLVADIQQKKENILYVVDGYDELISHQEHPLIKQCFNYLFNQADVLLTSRQVNTKMSLNADRHIRIVGFSKEQSFDYIKKYFNDNPEKAQQLCETISNNIALRPIVATPILLEILCWLSKRNIALSTLSFTSTLYYRFLTELVRWNLSKQEVSQEPMDLEGKELLLNTHYTQAIECLQSLAYESFIRESYIIDEEMLQTMHQKFPLSDLKIALQHLGFTRPLYRDGRFFENNFYFTHLTIQEYLTARHWVELFTNENPDDNKAALDLLLKHKHNPRYQVIWPFVAGILHEEQDIDSVNQYFHYLLNESHELTGVFETALLMRCLNETKFQGKLEIEKTVVEALKRFLQNEMHSSKDEQISLLIQSFIMQLKNHPKALMTLGISDRLIEACHQEKAYLQLSAAELLLSLDIQTDVATKTLRSLMKERNFYNDILISENLLYEIDLYLKSFTKDELTDYANTLLKGTHKFTWGVGASTLKILAAGLLIQLNSTNETAIRILVHGLKHWSTSIRERTLRIIEKTQIAHPDIIKALQNYNHILPTLLRLPFYLFPTSLIPLLTIGYIHSIYFDARYFKLSAAKVLLGIKPEDTIGERILISGKRSRIESVRLLATSKLNSIKHKRYPSKLDIAFDPVKVLMQTPEYVRYSTDKISYIADSPWIQFQVATDMDDLKVESIETVPNSQMEPLFNDERLEILVKALAKTKTSLGLYLLCRVIATKAVVSNTPLFLDAKQLKFIRYGKTYEEPLGEENTAKKGNELRNFFFQPSEHYSEKDTESKMTTNIGKKI